MVKIGDKKIYLRASNLATIMSGNFGLTEKQFDRLGELEQRNKGEAIGKNGQPLGMTPNMIKELEELEQKRDNPELLQGAKSYIDTIVLSAIYGFEKDFYSAQTAHGNTFESASIDFLNHIINSVLLDLGGNPLEKKLEKNEQRIYNDDLLLTGECDVIRPDYIIDIKCPYDGFSMHKQSEELLNQYFWQGQAYMALYNRKVIYFVYVLWESYYMDEGSYDHLAPIDRLMIHKVEWDQSAWDSYLERLPAVKNAIKDSVNRIKASKNRTVDLISEITEIENQ